MEYDKSTFSSLVNKYGEVFFVLDSGEEYEVHGMNSYEYEEYDAPVGHTRDFVQVEGMRDGEYLIVEFPLDAIEHHYTHREV